MACPPVCAIKSPLCSKAVLSENPTSDTHCKTQGLLDAVSVFGSGRPSMINWCQNVDENLSG